MSGRRWLQPWERADIARAVLEARAKGTKWKELEERFNMSRAQLWRVSRERMQQEKSGMQHHAPCIATAPA